ncbi:MAG TPA: UDP-N-acetylmuramate dehydrogenase [Candidatus Kapabacteria bacterium]|nr:UDP-N-acetylmuramate dehydrogenase [Candidatus Kapabacteria bacterium]
MKSFFRGKIALGEPLGKYTSFKIGGPADLYLEPEDDEDAAQLLRFLSERKMPFVVLGNGSNVLVADSGYRGAVINLEHGFGFIRMEGDEVAAGAGIRLAQFVDFCIQESLKGAEMLSGIPGTLGGAVIMNAGAYGGEISDHMTEIEIIRNGKLVRIKKDEAGFAYRTSRLQGEIVLGARFKFPHGDKEEMKTVRRETMLKRNSSQPVQFPNAGSIFKNPQGAYAAVLIQECGLKGTWRGGAEISEQHGNFIINKERASANDVLELIRLIRQTVHEKKNVKLELEVKLVGFDDTVMNSVKW